MNPGRLNNRVGFSLPEKTRGKYGAKISTDTQTFSRWAEVKQISSSESIEEKREIATNRVRVKVRVDSKSKLINMDWQLDINGIKHDIVGLDPNTFSGRFILIDAQVVS